MSDPGYTMLSTEYIKEWLRLKIRPLGRTTRARNETTCADIAKYTGIPRDSLQWFAQKETSRMSADRQRLLSKVIAMVENGLLDFEVRGQRKVAVLRDKPKPKLCYRVEFHQPGRPPTLTAVPKPPLPFRPMPRLKDLLLTGK